MVARSEQERGAVVVVSRNNLHLTKLTVKSALAQHSSVPDLIVIDNASSDGTAQWLGTKDFNFVCLPKQISLAACWNLGLFYAFHLGHDHALCLNNDVEIRPDAYHWLHSHGGPFVTCVSVGTQAELRYPNPPTTESPHPDFSCFLIRRSCYERVGEFDESLFPAWFEDNDYHIRMHRAGVRAVSIDVPFLHHAASTLKSAGPAERSRLQRGYAENKKRFVAKYGATPGEESYDLLFSPTSSSASRKSEQASASA